jgi:hypothetical protein
MAIAPPLLWHEGPSVILVSADGCTGVLKLELSARIAASAAGLIPVASLQRSHSSRQGPSSFQSGGDWLQKGDQRSAWAVQ